MKIYIASKAKHRPLWRSMRDKGFELTSRWIDVPDEHLDRDLPPGFDFEQLWIECVEDVLSADVLLVYADDGEVLKGAILEVGVALGAGMSVYAFGPERAFLSNGTWLYHPSIVHLGDIDTELAFKLSICG